MRRYTVIALLILSRILCPVSSTAQVGIISTFAGNHVSGFSGDGGSAAMAEFNQPNGIAIDRSGNIFVSDYSNQRIRKISTTGIITTFAGTGSSGFSGDGGPATAAQLNSPVGLMFDTSGNLFIADASNDRIRKISTSGIITTFAGNGSGSYSGDGGQATAASLHWPSAIALDSNGNIYVADYSNNRVRIVSPTGIITTFAGTGIAGYSGDGGMATSAEMNGPYGVTVRNNGDVYIGEHFNDVVRKVSTTGVITTFAGTGVGGYSGDGGPATATNLDYPQITVFDKYGNAYIENGTTNHRIREVDSSGIIKTVAGDGTAGYSGDGGVATLAEINNPSALVFDTVGNLYISEFGNNIVRKLQFIPNYSTDSFSVFISGTCLGPEITLVPKSYHSGMYIKTFYGDGSTDSSTISSAGYLTINHNYDNSGTYTIKHLLFSGVAAIDSVQYTYSQIICNNFAVKFYYDAVGDCIDAGSDFPLTQPILVQVDSSGIAIDTISATSGLYYTAYGPLGCVYSFIVLSMPLGFNITCPSGGILYDTISATAYSGPTKYLGVVCNGVSGFDLNVNAVVYQTGVNDQNGEVYIRNSTCSSPSSALRIYYSKKFLFLNGPGDAIPAPIGYSDSTITWDFSSITINDVTPVNIYYRIWDNPATGLLTIGDTFYTSFTVTPYLGDVDTLNNSDTGVSIVKGGCDPNEMWVSPTCVASDAAANRLQYTINFENTGNDTAFNVYVMDTLPGSADISSMRLVMASNEMYISQLKDAVGDNILKFDFPAINLLDSSHHNQCNGAVVFGINTRPGLPDGAQIYNRAGIYFDVNPVVMTNTVTTTIGCPVTSVPIINKNSNANIYPNPTTGELTIQTAQGAYNSFTITNTIGQTMLQQPLNGAVTTVNMSMLPSGVYYITLRGESGSTVQKVVKW